MRALFIHRSVGQNFIIEGHLRELLRSYNVALDDYDNNSGSMTDANGSVATDTITIPGNNTNPDNLARYLSSWDVVLDNYALVIIKSCYPNSHVKDNIQLQKIKRSYQIIFHALNYHQKRAVLLTSPPLRPLFTNKREAQLMSQLNNWLLNNAGEYVRVLDIHALLVEQKGRHKGMLCQKYRRLFPLDNHPNKKANEELAPIVADFIAAN